MQPLAVIVFSEPLNVPFSRLPVRTPLSVPPNPLLFVYVPVRLSPSAAAPGVAAVVAPETMAPPGMLKNSEISQGTWM